MHTLPVPVPLVALATLFGGVSIIFAGYVAGRVSRARTVPSGVALKWCGGLLVAFYGAVSILAAVEGELAVPLIILGLSAIPATRWGARIANR